MKSTMLPVAAVYSGCVGNFYIQSGGFTKFYNELYAYWKLTPIIFLALFAFFHGAGLGDKQRKLATVGLLFGALGDYLIGVAHEGIVPGAIAFGIGHIVYMNLFVSKSPVCYPVAAAVVIWGALLGHVCILPLLTTHPISVAIMTTYSLILSTCVIVAVSQYILRSKNAAVEPLFSRMLGFCLFFASDSMLILDHSGFGVPFAELLILGTYYSAQYFIFHSFVEDSGKKIKSN